MSIAAYLPDLAILLTLFLAAASIRPDDVPAERLSLRGFYLSNSPYFWTDRIPPASPSEAQCRRPPSHPPVNKFAVERR